MKYAVVACAVLMGAALQFFPGPEAAWALDEEHPQTRRDPHAPLGPLCSDVAPDGFSLNIGARDNRPHAARLLVYDAQARPRPGDPPLALVESAPAPWHLLRVQGLLPQRRYLYKVELDGHPDSNGEVSTAPPAGARTPLLLAAFGDERDAASGIAPVARAIVQGVLSEGPDLLLGTGDLVTQGGRWSDWMSLLDNHAPLFAQLPYYPALGNHELIGESDFQTFKDLFPRAALGYYAVRYGQALIVVLNSNRPSEPQQTRFLEDELRAAATDQAVRARLVLLHHAPLSASWHCGAAPYMTDWLALFERYHVDVVLGGHDHCYQRLERNGIAYVVSGGGGAPLYEQGSCDPSDRLALQHYTAAHHYVLIRITPTADPRHDAIAVSARVPGGAVFDSATLPLPRAAVASVKADPLAPGVAPPNLLRTHRLMGYAKRKMGPLLLGGGGLVFFGLVWRRGRRRATPSAR